MPINFRYRIFEDKLTNTWREILYQKLRWEIREFFNVICISFHKNGNFYKNLLFFAVLTKLNWIIW
jgi:hypothetical protein